MLVNQPGKKDAAKFIAAAKSEQGDLAVIYLPEGAKVEIKTELLKAGLTARWYHPRTGGWLSADEPNKSVQAFTPADRNDWILLLQAKQ